MVLLIRDRETLVAALRERGVDYLAPSDAQGKPLANDETLIASLAGHPDARVRQALVALFLLEPHLAACVPRLRAELDQHAAQELLAYYMAAMYLQTMWRTRLGHYLKSFPELPDYFSAELGLPKATELYGKAGLYALAEWHARHSSYRFNHLSAYEGVADLLFQSLKRKRRQHELTSRSIAR